MDNLQLSQGGCFAFTSGALAIATTTSAVKTTATVTYTVDGVFKSKSATDNMSIAVVGSDAYGDPGNGSFTGVVGGSSRLYGLFLDTDGALTCYPGPIANTAEVTAGTAALHYPAPQRSKACIGAIRVDVTEGTTFIPGTTALSASGVTETYINLSSIPGEPIRS